MLQQNINTNRLNSAAVGCAALTPSAPLALMPPPSLGANQPVSVSRLQMQLHLQGLQQSTNALRKQLSQLRNMQVGGKRSDWAGGVHTHPEILLVEVVSNILVVV